MVFLEAHGSLEYWATVIMSFIFQFFQHATILVLFFFFCLRLLAASAGLGLSGTVFLVFIDEVRCGFSALKRSLFLSLTQFLYHFLFLASWLGNVIELVSR